MTAGLPATWAPAGGAHYLHPQVSSRVPRRYVFLDTEAWRRPAAGGEDQVWRLGVTASVKWREGSGTWSPIEPVRHRTPDELWQAVTAFARTDARTVVVAHNLAYDLRISGALAWLVANGWAVERPTLSGEHVSLEVTRDRLRLVLVDSISLLPTGLAHLGKLLGEPKPELPDGAADEEDWWHRCEQDVRILARAYMAVMGWLREDDLGGWARTGAGIGWHTLLRRHLDAKVLVHRDLAAREAEAAAMYAGRAEVHRHGPHHGGPFWEWDYTMAYGNVMATTSLPAVLTGMVRGKTLAGMQASWPSWRWLVRARVDQDLPVLPWRDATGICWPTGTLEGWWWDVELVAAEAAGARVRPLQSYRYVASPWLAGWAEWAMGLAGDTSTPEAAVIGVAAKQWCRSVPGRTAMQYRAWEHAGDAYAPGVGYMPMLDVDSGARGSCLTIGDQRWEAWSSAWWDNALPQVLSCVMAVSRVRLWDALVAAGLDHVLYCDTDGLIVDNDGHARLSEATAAGRLAGLRVKAHHSYLDLLAPQLVEGSTFRRLAGIPRGARRRADGTYSAEVWEGITGAMSAGHPDQVHVRQVTMRLEGTDTRRLHLPGGATAPFTVAGGVRSPAVEEAS